MRNNVNFLKNKDYAYMIRTVDLENDDFENNVTYVDKHAYNILKKSKVYGIKIIINKIGNAGKVYIVPALNKKMTLGMNQFMNRPVSEIENYYLYIFLISKYGKLQCKINSAYPLS